MKQKPTPNDQERSTDADDTSYWWRSQSPLAALIFLVPLIVFYELNVLVLIRMDRPMSDIKARRLLFDFFEWMGINGYYLPGLVVVAVLMGWHLARRDPWRFEPRLYLIMWLESLILALPLFVFGWMLARHMAPVAAMADRLAPIVLSIGAGIYEELLFRLMGLALLHMLLVDWLRFPRSWGAVVVIGITAIAFSFYHDPFSSENQHRFVLFLFYAGAGVYFACVYLVRGFGIVAWTHALYDVLVFVLRMQQQHDP